MKFARQSGANVFQTYYMAEGGIDGQNSFYKQLFLDKGVTLLSNIELRYKNHFKLL